MWANASLNSITPPPKLETRLLFTVIYRVSHRARPINTVHSDRLLNSTIMLLNIVANLDVRSAWEIKKVHVFIDKSITSIHQACLQLNTNTGWWLLDYLLQHRKNCHFYRLAGFAHFLTFWFAVTNNQMKRQMTLKQLWFDFYQWSNLLSTTL